jgi:type II secretory pathway pseudopilin PulG
MTHRTRAQCSGFTLLEILVAFTIATTALDMLFRVHANSTATVVLSEQYQGATALAQTLIAEYSVTERVLAFTRAGSTDEFDWAVRASGYAAPTEHATAQRPPYELRSIEAEVRWSARGRGRHIVIRTVKPLFAPLP